MLKLLLRLERGGEAVDELKLPRPLGVEQQLPVIVAVVVRVAVVCARTRAVHRVGRDGMTVRQVKLLHDSDVTGDSNRTIRICDNRDSSTATPVHYINVERTDVQARRQRRHLVATLGVAREEVLDLGGDRGRRVVREHASRLLKKGHGSAPPHLAQLAKQTAEERGARQCKSEMQAVNIEELSKH